MNLENKIHTYQNKYVIVRSYDSGVHFGILENYNEETRHVTLKESRRLWKWRGFTLSEISQNGMSDDQAKISITIPEIIIMNVIEIIPCSEKSISNIKLYPAYAV